jgi:hypothetical protein
VEEGKTYFAVSHGENARQTISLPCVFFERTAKSLFVVRFFFAVRSIKNARQISSLLCARKKKTHGKDFGAQQTRVFR